MGSVKDLIRGGKIGEKWYTSPSLDDFGQGPWGVKGTFSVRDLKYLLGEFNIKNKPEALAMVNGAFMERLADKHPDMETCYLGFIDRDNKRVDLQTLLDRGETSNIVLMKLAHTPKSYSGNDLRSYRAALSRGTLRCGVADVESIFRKGFPLGSSTFRKIFEAVDMGDDYNKLSTYQEVASHLGSIRELVEEIGLYPFPELEKLLQDYGLGTTIPNPGFVLRDMVFDTTTKYEEAGDREIGEEEAKKLSGLSAEGYELWKSNIFPRSSQEEIAFCDERNILNIDGKGEVVAHKGMPVITDFRCTPDENRLMITIDKNGEKWAIPSNKEIQRAKFTEAGIDVVISEAKKKAEKTGDKDKWRDYVPKIAKDMKVDIKEVGEYSCKLMEYAIAEVANRVLGKTVFDAPSLETWVDDFMPFASKIEYQK